MKKFLKLTRILLKTGVGGNNIYDENGKKGSKIKKRILYIFLAICLVPFIGTMGYLGYEGYKIFEGFNTSVILGLASYVAVFLAFFFGMTMCVGVFYSSDDTAVLIPLPLKPEQIVGAKFVTMYVYNMATISMFVLPVFIGYGIAGKMGLSYWIISVLSVIIIPITPLVYGGVLTMILIRVFKKARNKDLLTVLTTGFAILLVLVINSFTTSFENASQIEIMNLIMEKGNSIIDMMSAIFPNTLLVEGALANENFVELALYLLTSVAFLAVFIIVARLVYLKTVVEMSDTIAKSRKMTGEQLKKANRQKSKILSYTIKELRLVFRTPIYFMNCIMLSLIWPVIMIVPAVAQTISGLDENGGGAETSIDAFIDILNQNPDILSGLCVVVMFAFTVLAISFCMMNSTVISREGKNVFFMKCIPMSYKSQLIAKVLPGIIVTFITGTIYSIVGILAVSIIYGLKIPVAGWILGIAISIVSVILFNMVEIITDIIKPKLEWQNEQAAVKQNMLAIIPMLLLMAIAIGVCVVAIILKVNYDFEVYPVAIGMVVLLSVLSFIVYKLIVKLADKHFALY